MFQFLPPTFLAVCQFGWDESKKQWVNKEGDAVEDQEPAPPPPVVQSVGPSDHTGGNMFSKVPKTRGDLFGEDAFIIGILKLQI